MKNSENTRERDNKNETRQDAQRQYKHDTKADQDPQVGCAKILLFAMDQRILVLIRPLLILIGNPTEPDVTRKASVDACCFSWHGCLM